MIGTCACSAMHCQQADVYMHADVQLNMLLYRRAAEAWALFYSFVFFSFSLFAFLFFPGLNQLFMGVTAVSVCLSSQCR